MLLIKLRGQRKLVLFVKKKARGVTGFNQLLIAYLHHVRKNIQRDFWIRQRLKCLMSPCYIYGLCRGFGIAQLMGHDSIEARA